MHHILAIASTKTASDLPIWYKWTHQREAQRLLLRLPLGTLTTISGLRTSITGAARSANKRVQYATREAVAACVTSLRHTVRSLKLRHSLPKLPAAKQHASMSNFHTLVPGDSQHDNRGISLVYLKG